MKKKKKKRARESALEVDQGEDQGATAEEEAPVKKKKKRVRDSSVEDLRASAE